MRKLIEGVNGADRLLVPTADEWVVAGTLLARRARLYGAVRPRDHLPDVLIVVSAARIGGEILTANARDFEAWAELARRAGLDVSVKAISATYLTEDAPSYKTEGE